jgi:protein-disulfide isomerase
MSRKHGWLMVLVVVALLAVACGPEMPTTAPTEGATAAAEPPTAAAVAKTPTTAQKEPATPAGQSVASGDVHSLGSADAPVTMIEYSDFQ